MGRGYLTLLSYDTSRRRRRGGKGKLTTTVLLGGLLGGAGAVAYAYLGGYFGGLL